MSYAYTYPQFSQTGLPAEPLVEKAFDVAIAKLKEEVANAEKELDAKEAHTAAHIAEIEASRDASIAKDMPRIKQQLASQGRTDVTDEMLKDALERNVDRHIEGHRQELEAEMAELRQFNQSTIDNIAGRALFLLENCAQKPSGELIAASLIGYSIGTISSFWDAQEAMGPGHERIFKTIADFTGIMTGQKNFFEVGADSLRLFGFSQKIFLEQRLEMARKAGPQGDEQAAILAQLMDGGGGVSPLDQQQALLIYQGILAVNRIEPAIAKKLVGLFNDLSEASKTAFKIESSEDGNLRFTTKAAPSSGLGSSFDSAAKAEVSAAENAEPEQKGSAKDWLRRKKGGPSNG